MNRSSPQLFFVQAAMNSVSWLLPLVLALAPAALQAQHAKALDIATGRERISIDEGWRFHQGDPAGMTADLRYDVRPVLKRSEDGKAADAEPQEAEKIAETSPSLLKRWILPTGNAFLKDAGRRYVRPPGNPGEDVSYVKPGFDDSGWEAVDLPHDWAIKGPFLAQGPYGGMGRLPSWGIGWYRRKLEIPEGDRGRSIHLEVDGAMSYSTVWLNGKLVGGWPYGYTSWQVDLTPFVAPGGTNELVIRLDNPPESSRWYPGGGIYRNVWLTKTGPVHVAQWGVTIATPEVSQASAKVELKIALENRSLSAATVDVMTELHELSADGQTLPAVVARIDMGQAHLNANSSGELSGAATVKNPRRWGPPPEQKPNRYVAITTLSRSGVVIDRYSTPFGIRSLRFDPDHGVFVNDQHVMLNGVNDHHDLGALGAAFNVRAAQRQLEELREMGVNALRMSHNPPAPELLELADQMGFLVVDEIFDTWLRQKTLLDFHLVFADWHEQDLRAMIRRDRNHPSVVFWSIGNEVGEQYTGEQGAAIGKDLVRIVHEEDGSRPTMTAMNYAKPDMPLPAVVDAISLNYQGAGVRSFPGQYGAFHRKFPDKVIFSSESAASLSSRGEYQFPVSGSISGPVRPGVGGDPKTHQVSAYEIYAADFGSSPDRTFAAQDENPFVAGEFVWSGWDYLGEPTPYYEARSSYFGIIDLAGFKKDRFYLYQSRWRPDLPMVHILPHWTWPGREGEVTPVHVFTSGDEAELFINGKSQGRKKKAPYEYRLRWDYVTYEPGELKVVAYKNGKQWATAVEHTADAPAKLEAAADRTQIASDGRDLSFIELRIVDKNGLPAPTANNLIHFTLDGPGDIVATDNGDPTSFVPFGSPSRKAFNGLCLVIVRGHRNHPGTLTLHATSESLQGTSIVLRTAAPPLNP
ncbi:MAG TPA: beta-galactosidase GalB [Acidobacteriaceae bacterium]|jgi:beta-galactosidase